MNTPIRALCALVLLFVVKADASAIAVGFVGTEPGTPIGGEEDLVVYNSTGTTFGCSSAAGTPVCTAVTFDNVVLTVNNTVSIHLGDIAPGVKETDALPGGVFVSGSITSLTFSATLSSNQLTQDSKATSLVDPAIMISGLAVNGNLNTISATTVSSPEPATLPGLFVSLGVVLLAGRRRLSRCQPFASSHD